MTAVYRLKGVIHVERVQRDKVNGQATPVPIKASNVVITKLEMGKEAAKARNSLIARKTDGLAKRGSTTNDMDV